MCDKCTELDKKLDRYEELSGWGIDKTALEGIHFLIAKYKAEKKALDPHGKAPQLAASFILARNLPRLCRTAMPCSTQSVVT